MTTLTLTAPQLAVKAASEVIPLTLVLKMREGSGGESSALSTVRDKISSLIKEITSSTFLQPLQHKEILEWRQIFTAKFLSNPLSEEESKEAQLTVCFLSNELIEPLLEQQKGHEENQFKVLDFLDEAAVILKLLVGENGDPTALMETFRQCSSREALFQLRINRIEACFEERVKQSVDSANAINQKMKKGFEDIKASLVEFNKHSASISKTLNERLDILNTAVERAAKALTINGLAAEVMGERMLNEQANLTQSLETITNGIK